MKKNDYIGLLESDSILIKDPTNQEVNRNRSERRLFRVIALKSFQVKLGDIGPTNNYVFDLYHNHLRSKISKHNSLIVQCTSQLESLNNNSTDSKLIQQIENELGTLTYYKENLERELLKYTPQQNIKFTIPIHQIGGYVENLDWFDANNPSWVAKFAMIFNGATCLNSYITDRAIISGNPIIENSWIMNSSSIKHGSRVSNSILSNMAEVSDISNVSQSQLVDFVRVFDSASISNTLITNGAFARKNSNIENSVITDTSHAEEDSQVNNSLLCDNYVAKNGRYDNGTFSQTVDLKETVSE